MLDKIWGYIDGGHPIYVHKARFCLNFSIDKSAHIHVCGFNTTTCGIDKRFWREIDKGEFMLIILNARDVGNIAIYDRSALERRTSLVGCSSAETDTDRCSSVERIDPDYLGCIEVRV